MGNQKERILWADVLKIAACMAVVLIHVSAEVWSSSSVASLDWHVSNFYDSLGRWAVPVFVMLSGMFLLNPEKEMDARTIYRKYIPRILIAIVFWGLFYRCTDIVHSIYFRQATISMRAAFVEFMEIPFGTAWFHLWYLYMLLGLYVLIPFYRVFTKNADQKEIQYMLALFSICGIVLPFIKDLLLLVHPRLNLNLVIPETINYSGYFLAGYFLSKMSFSPKTKGFLYTAAILSFVVTVVGTSFLSSRQGNGNQFLYGYLTPVTMFEAVAVFVFVNSFKNWRPSEKSCMIISNVSNCTFGIYLLHPFIIRCFNLIGFTSLSFNPVIAIPLLSIAAFLVSMIIVFFLRRISFFRIIM